MPVWEYDIIRHNIQKTFLEYLNEAGAEGWELVAVEKDAQNYYLGMMKREVIPAIAEDEEETVQENTIPKDYQKTLEEASRLAVFNNIFNREKSG